MKKEETKLINVNLGCGNRKQKEFINVDHDEECKPDVVADLNKKFPFKDNSVDNVYSSHVIEHVDDVFHFMYEIWRICKNKSKVLIIAPNYSYAYWAIQPDHKRFIRLNYFQYWLPKEFVKNAVENYSKVTKGAEFIPISQRTFNEDRELEFMLEVVK